MVRPVVNLGPSFKIGDQISIFLALPIAGNTANVQITVWVHVRTQRGVFHRFLLGTRNGPIAFADAPDAVVITADRRGIYSVVVMAHDTTDAPGPSYVKVGAAFNFDPGQNRGYTVQSITFQVA
jgi:hypothetical protein